VSSHDQDPCIVPLQTQRKREHYYKDIDETSTSLFLIKVEVDSSEVKTHSSP